MSRVLVIGAGLSGCTTAVRLAQAGVDVILAEKGQIIGGRVRTYGCKATDKCNNCGVCLTGGLWDKASRHPKIRIITEAVAVDVSGVAGDFSVTFTTPQGNMYLNNISSIVISTGFESFSYSSHLQIEGTEGLITGLDLEKIMLNRDGKKLFESPVGSVAFIQCFGSRDEKENAMYCSRVCCAYSTRAAKVIRKYDPDCSIAFFYMELQSVANEDYFAGLNELGMEFIKCRPIKISGGQPAVIEYDDPKSGITRREFDLVVLSEGIHPTPDNDRMAEVYGLGQDSRGFLRTVGDSAETGIYVSGCARTPLKIDETYADSMATADAILASGFKNGGFSL